MGQSSKCFGFFQFTFALMKCSANNGGGENCVFQPTACVNTAHSGDPACRKVFFPLTLSSCLFFCRAKKCVYLYFTPAHSIWLEKKIKVKKKGKKNVKMVNIFTQQYIFLSSCGLNLFTGIWFGLLLAGFKQCFRDAFGICISLPSECAMKEKRGVTCWKIVGILGLWCAERTVNVTRSGRIKDKNAPETVRQILGLGCEWLH